ncbi:VOC family protein [Microbacterium sp. NPDC090003]|uniref:VOC family protein n=1 Tax=Microbacterium sp. NPDC090003 TaxID=3364203 RepID=UPI00381CFABD
MPGLHHVEVWVADPESARRDWGWLLPQLGYSLRQEWAEGQTWTAESGPYLTITTPPHVDDRGHDRRRPGVNHLAFHGGDEATVDGIMAAAAENGWRPLYHERYPHAGGPDHYAGWLENAAGFKVEIVAEEA